jgi:hypothetical protein
MKWRTENGELKDESEDSYTKRDLKPPPLREE